jgi:uncharacterized 2Fe-2S/4Fe-4S cluster protein (DUF4445 family)
LRRKPPDAADWRLRFPLARYKFTGMTHNLRLLAGRRSLEIAVDEDSRLIDALAALDPSLIDAPCGGKGLCGKCRVKAVSGRLSVRDERESLLVSEDDLRAGIRLACRARVEGDAEIGLFERGAASILSVGPAADGPEPGLALDPPVRLVVVSPERVGLEGRTDDESRLLAALGRELSRLGAPELAPKRVALGALPGLAASLREGVTKVGAVVAEGEVWGVAPLRPGSRPLGVGLDLGTTTLVAILVDLGTGERLGSRSELNAQRPFGADVISRIAAASDPGGLEALRSRITSQVSSMALALAEGAGARPEDIACFAIAGNTTMLHLLAGAPPDAIARSPFAPAFLSRRTESAAALGLARHPGCAAILLPGLSAYVGADILAGLAAIGFHEAEGRSLFLDLGTNGEIAFGGKGGILCCATAAGPAFEGAGIEKGVGGVAGAIDSVWAEDGALRFGTIGDAPAAGICGSGLIDALAALLDCGIVDETGRMVDEAEARALAPALASLIADGKRGPLVYLDRPRGIYLSQADVRAAQLAKAAIAAGIDTLLRVAGAELADVDRIYMAGGFGSLLDLRSAARIGLLPARLADRAIVVGNASAAGATAACLSRRGLEDCDRARAASSYVELSSRPDFNEFYVERMFFPGRA